MQKQYYHGLAWLTEHVDQRIEGAGFKFKTWKNPFFSDLELMGRQQSEKKEAKGLLISITVKEPEFSIEENKLKKVFVDKSEAIEIMQQRRCFRVRQVQFSKFWDKVQRSGLNDKYVVVRGKSLLLQFEIPKKFRNRDAVIDVIKSLDEGRSFIGPETFKALKPGIHTFKIDYLYAMGRNMQKPIIELWKLNWKQTFVVAEVNPAKNMSLFTTYLKNKIFQRFEMSKFFNKLLSKHYYDSTINIHKLRVNIQGQQSLLFFNDVYQQIISRFVWEDISRGRDPDKKYLKYLMNLDRSRARLHGQLKISVLSVQMSVYAKRNFNRFDHYFQILFNDFICHQVYQRQQVCMRDFIIKKEPLQQFESLFVKLPIIEFVN